MSNKEIFCGIYILCTLKFLIIKAGDISADIKFTPDKKYFEQEVENVDTNSNSVICEYSQTATISWWKGNDEVIDVQNAKPVFQDKSQNRIYFSASVMVDDSGIYTCEVNKDSDYGQKNLTVCIRSTSSTNSPFCSLPTTHSTTDYADSTATGEIPKSSSSDESSGAGVSQPTSVSRTEVEKSTAMYTTDANPGLIGGIVVGILLMILIISIASYFWYKRRNTNKYKEQTDIAKAPTPNTNEALTGPYEEVSLEKNQTVIMPNNEYASIDGGYVPAESVAKFVVDNEVGNQDISYATVAAVEVTNTSEYQEINLQPDHDRNHAQESKNKEEKSTIQTFRDVNDEGDNSEYHQLDLQQVHNQADDIDQEEDGLYNRLYNPEKQQPETIPASKSVDLYTMVNKDHEAKIKIS